MYNAVVRPNPGSALTLLLALALGGCLASDPPQRVWDGGVAPDSFIMPDATVQSCPTIPVLDAPVVGSYPNPTGQLSQPLRGRAIGATSIVAQGPLGAGTPSSVSADGSFCVEVPLQPDQPNTVKLVPIDQHGCPGRAATLTLTHKATPTDSSGSGGATVRNVAQGRPVTTSTSPDEGKRGMINDGDPKSYAKFSFHDWEVSTSCNNGYVWLKLDLGTSYVVSKIKLRYPPQVGGDWAKGYAVLLSSKAAPPKPDTSKIYEWDTVKKTCSASSGTQEISIAPRAARWVAVLLYENDAGSWTFNEAFKIAEVEVWGQDQNATPAPTQDRCM